jgi:Na+/proline symporter
MTAFAILGSSGLAYRRGIGVYGLMASSSGFVIPLTLLIIGTRLWGLGKRFGHMTQVQFFRDRWECCGIGTFIFLLTAAMLIPYLIISIVGGGTILEELTHHRLPFAAGGAIVALVVMGNVFFGGMRGAVWVNVFQTLLFLAFGTVAFVTIAHNMDNGLVGTVQKMAHNQKQVWALNRQRIGGREFASYILIPLSSIMFPHMSIMCMTARKVTAFKKTVVLYPICIMILWLPCVFLGALAFGQPKVNAAIAAESPMAKQWLASGGATINGKPAQITGLLKQVKTGDSRELLTMVQKRQAKPDALAAAVLKAVGGAPPDLKPQLVAQVQAMANSNTPDSVLLQMLKVYVPALLAGILAAGIISAVMGSDCHQILALSTMFTKDIFDHYGGQKAFGDRANVYVGRAFIIVANTIAYLIALTRPQIFDLAVSWTFSGFAALAPVMVAALFWKRSTKWGALAAALFVALAVAGTGALERTYLSLVPTAPPFKEYVIWALAGHPILTLSAPGAKLFVCGFMPVAPMVIGSALCMIAFSLLTPPPSEATIRKYFQPGSDDATTGFTPTAARPTITV